jgi:undecaprenyl diphosphate synthase
MDERKLLFIVLYLLQSIVPFELVAALSPRNKVAKFPRPRVLSLQQAPKHVAYIVDGNGRWATEKGLPRSYGHTIGANVSVEIVRESFKMGAQFVTLYLFSTENWNRPIPEIANIMSLLERYTLDFKDYLTENRIELQIIGQTQRLSDQVLRALRESEYVCVM